MQNQLEINKQALDAVTYKVGNVTSVESKHKLRVVLSCTFIWFQLVLHWLWVPAHLDEFSAEFSTSHSCISTEIEKFLFFYHAAVYHSVQLKKPAASVLSKCAVISKKFCNIIISVQNGLFGTSCDVEKWLRSRSPWGVQAQIFWHLNAPPSSSAFLSKVGVNIA